MARNTTFTRDMEAHWLKNDELEDESNITVKGYLHYYHSESSLLDIISTMQFGLVVQQCLVTSTFNGAE